MQRCMPTNVDANILPEFIPKEEIVVLTIPEGKNLTAGTVIHKFRGFDQDGDILTFTISGEPSVREQFRLSRVSNTESNLVLKRELDRERMSEFIVEVSLTDGRTMRMAQQSVLVIVADVNDNSPLFKPFNATISMPESGQVPKLITLLEATDADEGPNSEIGFSLQVEQEDQTFFNLTQNDDGQAAVYLIKPFDYQRKSQYNVSIIAYDHPLAENPRETKISLTIDVKKVDRNVPIFNILPINNTVIKVDIPFGSQVFQVGAVVGNSQASNLIQYELLTENKKFAIERHTGIVRTNMIFNLENPPVTGLCYLRIKASKIELSEDGGRIVSNLSVETTLEIEILDLDESPKFRNESYQGLVPENSLEGYPILFKKWLLPQVYDHDMGGKTLIKLRIEGDGGVLEVMPSQGYGEFLFQFVVKDPRRLDYEQLQEIVFRLIAEDETGHSRTSLCSVSIIDVNDNYPVFSQDDGYYIRIPENPPAGSKIVHVSATDGDTGRYGTQGIRYKIFHGLWSTNFELDSETGQLTVGKSANSTVFDREQNAKIHLAIEAQDNLGSGNRNFTTVTIELEDENDNAPQFTQTCFEAAVTENMENIFLPFKIVAIDADEPGTPNSKVSYRLYLGENTSQFWIDLDSSTHQLLIKDGFDFEELAKMYEPVETGSVKKLPLNFTIEAFDFGVPRQTTRTNLTLLILDENDCAPQFSKTYYEVTIPKNLDSKVEVLKVEATDCDVSPRYNQVEYKLTGESASHAFVIDSISGIITLAPGVNIEQSSYLLEILALDGLGLQSEISCMINLTVVDFNNKSPYFLFPRLPKDSYDNNGVTWDRVTSSYLGLISPDFKAGTEILKVRSPNNEGRTEGSGFSIINPVYFRTIQDYDMPTFATLAEDLVPFAIDADTGSIYLNVALPKYLSEGSFIFHLSLPCSALLCDANPQYAQIEIFVMEDGHQLTLLTNFTAVDAEQQAENLSADLTKFFNLDVVVNTHSFLASETTVFKLLISDFHNPLDYEKTNTLLANSAEKLAPLFEKYKIIWSEHPLEMGATWHPLKSGEHVMIENEKILYLCCMVSIYVVVFLLWMLAPSSCPCRRDEETKRYEIENSPHYQEIIVGTGGKGLSADVGKEICMELQTQVGESDC